MANQRVVAWAVELQSVHHRLEDLLRAVRSGAAVGSAQSDLLAHCYAFCGALTDHHESEDAGLFPRLLAENPELAPVIAELKADHLVLASLIREFEATLAKHADSDGADRQRFDAQFHELHVRMSTHFADEERRLDSALDRLITGPSEVSELVGGAKAT